MTFDESCVLPPPLAKRQKYNQSQTNTQRRSSWKIYLTENIGPEGKMFGLHDLFSSARRRSGDTSESGSSAAVNQSGNFYTLRLEHRQGGPTAQHRGEERILLFRSDCRAAIAKIIYSSSEPSDETTRVTSESLPDSKLAAAVLSAGDDVGSEESDVKVDAAPVLSRAHAKIHVLDVKSQYRGRDLGGLLFSEAITSLKSRYCNDDEDDGEESDWKSEKSSQHRKHKRLCDVECILDAEEDITRHGKLVSFYEHLGCRVKSSGRIQYVNNNDSETYRKIPMQIYLHPSTVNSPSKKERARLRRKTFSHLVSSKGSFLPVHLVGSLGKLLVRSHASGEQMKLDWLVTETPEGIQFYTTHGHVLIANPGGDVTVLSPEDQDNEDSTDLDVDSAELTKWTHFVPCHVSDQVESGSSQGEGQHQSSMRRQRSQSVSYKDLWVLQTFHGTFLTADSVNHTLSCTRLPSFWQPNGENLSLVCTSDTPPRRHHYCKSWKFQTYVYVQSMRSRFLNFSLGKATLFEALEGLHAFPANPFHAWFCDDSDSYSSLGTSPSLRTLCFLMAETAREEGLPDWVQLVALFHELGEYVKIMDPDNTGEMAESLYDWTISSRSRVVGCRVPNQATFNWHEQHAYNGIANEEDEDLLPFVSEFDALRRRVRLNCMDCTDISDEQCRVLWESHYANIAAKYDCDHVFDW
eukprot:scaffold5203_cov195-Alexandrium_tamarense.AAC.1